MKLKKGEIKNINKKLIAGILATGITLVSFSGCASINDVDYETSQEGVVLAISNDVSFETLKNCYFVRIINNENNTVSDTIILEDNHKVLKAPKYYDLFTSKDVTYTSKDSVIYGSIAYYITILGMEQRSYSEEELKSLMQTILEYEENLVKGENKKLVKEK